MAARTKQTQNPGRRNPVKKKKILSRSVEQTMNAASNFAKSLVPGDVIALEGDLGAGKTTFIKGLLKGMGLRDLGRVKSPTFVIMHIYQTKTPVYHFDLYRLDSGSDFDAIGFDDFLYDGQGIACIEWAEKAKSRIPDHAYWLKLNHVNEKCREIIFQIPNRTIQNSGVRRQKAKKR